MYERWQSGGVQAEPDPECRTDNEAWRDFKTSGAEHPCASHSLFQISLTPLFRILAFLPSTFPQVPLLDWSQGKQSMLCPGPSEKRAALSPNIQAPWAMHYGSD
ncbi:uncharacterized [Tachysurus ichikawai]